MEELTWTIIAVLALLLGGFAGAVGFSTQTVLEVKGDTEVKTKEKPKIDRAMERLQEIGAEEPKKQEFHLTPEQVRSNALSSAIEVFGQEGDNLGAKDLISLAKDFEEFILGRI